jgi:hypothetical protein
MKSATVSAIDGTPTLLPKATNFATFCSFVRRLVELPHEELSGEGEIPSTVPSRTSTISLALLSLGLVLFGPAAQARELRVCADPNNLPFSNERGEGFENKIAELIADKLGATLSYTWWVQRRGLCA